MTLPKNIKLAVTKGDQEKLLSLITNAKREGRRSFTVIERALQKATEETGNKFSRGKIHLPDMLIAVKVVKKALYLLNGRILENKEIIKKDTIVIATIKENLYDIGETIATVMATAMGFRVLYLGIIEQCESLEEVLKKDKPHAVVLSGELNATLSTNDTKLMKESGLKNKLKLLIPGTPVAPDFKGRYGIEITYNASKKAKKFVQALRSNFGVVIRR